MLLRRRRVAELPTVTFNAWIGQDATDDRDPDDLRDNLRRMVADAADALEARPVTVCLQEVWDWDGTIPGYLPVRAPRNMFGPEGRSTVWLVLDDARVLHRGFRQTPGPGWVWNGKHKEPRVFPRIRVGWDRQVWDQTGVHRTPGGPRPRIELNRASWNAEHEMLAGWQTRIAEHRDDAVRVLQGDHNAGAGELAHYPYSIGTLAETMHAEAALRGVDGFLVAGAEVRGLERLAGAYGGDGHHATVATLAARV